MRTLRIKASKEAKEEKKALQCTTVIINYHTLEKENVKNVKADPLSTKKTCVKVS